MSRFCLSAVLAVVGIVSVFVGCQKAVDDEQYSIGKARLEISVPVTGTKVVSGIDETAVTNYQIFLFNDQEVLEAYVNTSSSEISVECTMGSKTVVALVNAPAVSDVSTLASLMSRKSKLSDNSADSFVMEGKVGVDIDTTEDVEVSVPVSRKVSKVELKNLVTEFELPQYREMEFKVTSVYLINVPAEMTYFNEGAPTLWFNCSEYVETDDNTLLYDDMDDLLVSDSSPYSVRNTFYSYPNLTEADSFDSSWSPRKTRLVVETTLGGEKYYYPVTIPSLEQNKRYEVNLTVTRPGSYDPDVIVDKFAGIFTIQVKDWEIGASVSEEI